MWTPDYRILWNYFKKWTVSLSWVIITEMKENAYLAISKTIQHSNQEPLKSCTLGLRWITLKTNRNACHCMTNLKWAERQIDKVPSIATPALHAFVCQHQEHHFMDSQKGNQDQCRSDQTGGHKQNPQCCTMTTCHHMSDEEAKWKALSSLIFIYLFIANGQKK